MTYRRSISNDSQMTTRAFIFSGCRGTNGSTPFLARPGSSGRRRRIAKPGSAFLGETHHGRHLYSVRCFRAARRSMYGYFGFDWIQREIPDSARTRRDGCAGGFSRHASGRNRHRQGGDRPGDSPGQPSTPQPLRSRQLRSDSERTHGERPFRS